MDVESIKEQTSYYQKGEGTKQDIVLRHIRKISDISSEEITSGYWEKKPMKTGSGILLTEKYNKDQRLAYIKAVDFLLDIIWFDLKEDKVFKKEFKDLEEEEKKEYKTAEKEKKTEDEWLVMKLKLREKLFRSIIDNLEEQGFFKGGTHGE